MRSRLNDINKSQGVLDMAEDDIYGSKSRYEKFVSQIDRLTALPAEKVNGAVRENITVKMALISFILRNWLRFLKVKTLVI